MARNRKSAQRNSARSQNSQNKNGGRSQKKGRLAEQKKELTGLTCPECHGAIWEVRDGDHGDLVQFNCRVGHSYGPHSMMEAHSDTLEQAMWAALRCLEENIALTKRLVDYSRTLGRDKAAEVYQRQIREKEKYAQFLHAMLDGESDELIKSLNSRERKKNGSKVMNETSVV